MIKGDSDLFRLTDKQFGRMKSCLPTDTREVPRANGRRAAKKGAFHRVFTELARMHANDGTVILGSSHIKVHHTAASLLPKRELSPSRTLA